MRRWKTWLVVVGLPALALLVLLTRAAPSRRSRIRRGPSPSPFSAMLPTGMPLEGAPDNACASRLGAQVTR